MAQATIEVDVCVYGGTSAGVIAAYAAQKQGKTAILIEPGAHLGGLTSGGLGYTDIGNKYAITGLARDFYRRVGQHYGVFEQWIFEPKVASTLFNDYVTRGGYQVMMGHRLKNVTKVGTAITQIVVENSTSPNPGTDVIVKAKMYIDCGYEGDLMAQAGVSYIVGRESSSVYNESLNGFQLRNNHQFPDGIDPYVIPGQPSSGLLWGISNGTVSPTGTGDNRVQAYNFRICLSNDPQNHVAITQPAGYDPTRYELLLRLFAAAPNKKALANYFIMSKMPNNKTDINNKGGFSSDMIGMNYDYPDASYALRSQIVNDHVAYTKGLLYFLGHDSRVPLQTRNEMLTYGYPADEYTDNGHWSPQLYVREARRMVGNYVMTQANCKGTRVANDGIGLAAYTMDSHHTQRIVVNGMVKNEGCVEVGGFGPYPIAYNSIIPKPAECSNMLVPVCLSASHIAYGSIRMEPVFMVLGQSAATAAVMAIDAGTTVQQVNVPALQQRLKDDPLADGSLFEILVDNEDAPRVQVTGTWSAQASGGYGPNFLVHPGTGSPGTVRFTPTIPTAGTYAAYIYFPKVVGISNHTTINYFDGTVNRQYIINESDIRVVGQTSGEWVSLDTLSLPQGTDSYVEVTTAGADGTIVADAVLWIPIAVEPPGGDGDSLRGPENPPNTQGGLDYEYYEGMWSALPDFSTLTAAETGNISNINLYPRNREDNYAFRFSGFIDIPADGEYTFYTTSDEGSQLMIGNTVVVNNDGLHTAVEASGTIGLNQGKHAFTVTFFERLGAA
ncbi:MAG TPA: FAD-dependent oxidoreductase, partial [Ohtaekwangia sp.]|nr:FAD-dependent oxidoreductase [Ohtaekwangia sp.]